VWRGFPARLAAAAVFLPILFYLIRLGGWAYAAFVLLVVLLGAWEWWRLGRSAGAGADLVPLAVGSIGACLTAIDPRPERCGILGGLLLVAALLQGLRHADGSASRRVGHLVLGALYVGLLPAFLIRMRALPHGAAALYLTYATVFLCDTAAYGVGRALGRHALWPRVSPRKTWEGAIAGLVASIATAVACRFGFADFLSVPAAAGFGLMVGVLGQVGDLVESLWKREAGVKDTSALVPGHGGVLDRFDNLHFVAPVLYTYLIVLR
jgi:phosphatidate cytidylyltransferase